MIFPLSFRDFPPFLSSHAPLVLLGAGCGERERAYVCVCDPPPLKTQNPRSREREYEAKKIESLALASSPRSPLTPPLPLLDCRFPSLPPKSPNHHHHGGRCPGLHRLYGWPQRLRCVWRWRGATRRGRRETLSAEKCAPPRAHACRPPSPPPTPARAGELGCVSGRGRWRGGRGMGGEAAPVLLPPNRAARRCRHALRRGCFFVRAPRLPAARRPPAPASGPGAVPGGARADCRAVNRGAAGRGRGRPFETLSLPLPPTRRSNHPKTSLTVPPCPPSPPQHRPPRPGLAPHRLEVGDRRHRRL